VKSGIGIGFGVFFMCFASIICCACKVRVCVIKKLKKIKKQINHLLCLQGACVCNKKFEKSKKAN